MGSPIKRHQRHFFRYAASGAVAVAVDVGLLSLLLALAIPKIGSVLVSSMTATFVHYVLSRYVVFFRFARTFTTGLVYFYGVIALSTILNITLYLLLSKWLVAPEWLLRAVAIMIVGVLSFTLNARYTFRAWQDGSPS